MGKMETVVRQDAWTEREDSILASLVIRFIAKGSTQLKAFERAGEMLERTASACGYRWNSQVRKQYKNEIAKAKKERYSSKYKTRADLPVELEVAATVEEPQEPTTPAVNEVEALKQEIAGLKQYLNTIENIQMKDLHQKVNRLEKERDDQFKRANKYQALFHRSLQMSKIYSEVKALETV
jgi:prespore-specific regulator